MSQTPAQAAEEVLGVRPRDEDTEAGFSDLVEEEMEEIRARMAPDVRDLKAHLDPGARGAKAGRNIRERLRSFIRRD